MMQHRTLVLLGGATLGLAAACTPASPPQQDQSQKFHGATGEVLWTTLPGLTVMLKLDKPIDPAPNCSGGYFHSIAIRALEVID